MKKRKLKIKFKVLIIILVLILLGVLGWFLYAEIHGFEDKLILKLNGPKTVKVDVGKLYNELGAKATYDNKDISKKIKITGKVNKDKVGDYILTYKIKHKYISKKIKRKVKILDNIKPVIVLEYDDLVLYQGNEYKEPGVTATDNLDGDITDKIETTNNINKDVLGAYEVTYKVKDSSDNLATATRKVEVIPKINPKIAVLNYHFFYDETKEGCNETICESISDFKAHLNYLKENNFKTLTMKEFRDFMYEKIDLPEKSVLITIDDGALGTGKHNGNRLIPILEEYKMHATLFLITGWWDIENYRSPYLDIESHTNDMHKENRCRGVERGAQMLCSTNEEVLNDLKKSISITKSKLAFCFPFYAYNNNSIELVKEAGFDLAFIGGNTKATRKTDKYHIPRYVILKHATLQDFIRYVN